MTTLTTATEQQATEPQPTAPPAADLSRDVRRAATRNVLRALGWSLLTFVLTLVAALAIWVGVLWVFQISPLIAKGPVDVWNFLFVDEDAAEEAPQIGIVVRHEYASSSHRRLFHA